MPEYTGPTPTQRREEIRRRVRADFPRGARVAGQDANGAYVGRVVGYHERRNDWSARPKGILAHPTLLTGPIVRDTAGHKHHAQSFRTFRVPNLTRCQEWLLVAAHHNGGLIPDRVFRNTISLELLFCADGSWHLTRRGAIVARALASLAPLPRLGFLQLRTLATVRDAGGVMNCGSRVLEHHWEVLTRLGLIEESVGGAHLLLTPLGERTLNEAPYVSDLLQTALAAHGLTGQVADISGGDEALIITAPHGQILASGRTSGRIGHQTWDHEGLDVYLAPEEGGSWSMVYASRNPNPTADVREAAAAIAAHLQDASRP